MKDHRKLNIGYRGFTAIELMVVLSVFSLLIALIAPAVLSARESSRKVQCASKLKEIGIAIHAHVSTHQRLPPGAVPEPVTTAPISSGERVYSKSGFVRLLPYLDQMNLSVRLSETRPVRPLWNPDFLPESLNLFLPALNCPSESHRTGTSYRLCAGIGPHFFRHSLSDTSAGAFSSHVGITFGEVIDGSSNTVAVSEKRIADQSAKSFSSREDSWYTGYLAISHILPSPDEMVRICGLQTTTPSYWYPYSGRTWLLTSFDYTIYNHLVTPNSEVPDCSVNNVHREPQSNSSHPYVGSNGGLYKASGYHKVGVNVLYMDGSVRFVADSISTNVWRDIATIRGRVLLHDF